MSCTTPSLTPVVGTAALFAGVAGVAITPEPVDADYLLGIGSKQSCVWVLDVTDVVLETDDGFAIETDQFASDDPIMIDY